MSKGTVSTLLNKIYEFKSMTNEDAATQKRIIRLQLTLKTGLSMSKFTSISNDSEDEVKKVVTVLRSPEFGLTAFPFDEYLAQK